MDLVQEIRRKMVTLFYDRQVILTLLAAVVVGIVAGAISGFGQGVWGMAALAIVLAVSAWAISLMQHIHTETRRERLTANTIIGGITGLISGLVVGFANTQFTPIMAMIILAVIGGLMGFLYGLKQDREESGEELL